MNKKGQALVEFIIVLPIFILTILAVLDIVNIYSAKSSLEDTMEEVILSSDYKLDENIKLEETSKDGKTTYILSKKVDISSPFISAVIDNPYDVIVTRTTYEK